MSYYTTGEVAKLCGVTVRTVQYYDNRRLLCPSQLSEGGRRLYTEDDVRKMRIICFLRELDLPLNTISQLFAEEHPEKVIDLLLLQQENELRGEIRLRQDRLNKLEQLRRQTQKVEHFSVESIFDIAHIMENKKKLRRVRWTMLGVGLVMEALEIGTVLLGVFTGRWWPLIISLPIVIALAVWMSLYYFKSVRYICPQCHNVFQPSFKEAFWANHTPNTRKLTCPACKHKGFCVETCGE